MSRLTITDFAIAQNYRVTLKAMKDFSAIREKNSPDQLWLMQHPHVYTQGLAGKSIHIKQELPHEIVATDRGGQVTYHGPGQLMGYIMLDLRRKQISITELIDKTEQLILKTLTDLGLDANLRADIGRGVFIADKKIASIGFKVKRYCSYHGFALNINTDLSNFKYIDACGIKELSLVNINSTDQNFTDCVIKHKIVSYFSEIFCYKEYNIVKK